MLTVETIGKIRHAHHRQGKSIRQIARDYRLSKNTVKKILRNDVTEPVYRRAVQPRPKLSAFEERLSEWLSADQMLPVKERRSSMLLFAALQREGFAGGYDSVRRFVQQWKEQEKRQSVKAYIPLSFAPGEAFQFDWSAERVELSGSSVMVSVAQFRLCHSRMPFCVGYTRETLEMVLDAHVRAIAFYGGACRRGIYDNLKTVVAKVLLGKERNFNRKFLALASHYLFEPVACTPAAGWEKGQVENQVGFVRGRIFNARRKFADLAELNRYLVDQCRTLAVGHRHPEFPDRTVGELFEEERRHLLTVRLPFDGYREELARVSATALVLFERNRYSVHASTVGKTATVRVYADRLVIADGDRVIGEHRRLFGRDKTAYDPWHYVEVLERKPGALRNGAPFKEWDLPEPLKAVRAVLSSRSDGDRQYVGILAAVPTYGADKVASACSSALDAGSVSKDVVLSILGRGEDALAENCEPPDRLPRLTLVPVADCGRYDRLLGGGALAP
jgi:transposase